MNRLRSVALLCLAIFAGACQNGPGADTDHYSVIMLETPAAPGSMAPNLVRGADGSLVMSWIETGDDIHALRYAVFDDGRWGGARTVVTGENWFVNWADFPSVVPISDSLWGAHWLVRREAGGYAYEVHAALSSDAGRTWSAPFLPHTDDTDTEHGFVTLFPADGGVGMLWLDGRKMVNEFDANDVAASGMTLRAAVFDADATRRSEMLVDDLICDCCQTDVALTPDGPVAVYRDRTVDEIRDIHITRFEDGAWLGDNAVGNDRWEIPGCPVNGPVIQATDTNVAVAWFSAAGGKPRVQVAWSGDAGRTLSKPVEVAAGRLLGHVGAALLPDGDIAVTWLQSAAGGAAELHARRVAAGGTAGPDLLVAEAAGVAPFSVPQMAVAGDRLLLTWTDTSAEQSQVRSALLPLPLLDQANAPPAPAGSRESK